jgi:hypothetical protein
MSGREKLAVFVVSLSTLLSAVALAMLLYTELMDYFSTKAFSWAALNLWCKRVLMGMFASAAVAVVGVLLAGPQQDSNQKS